MAMPASGCIALRTCIVGIACSSISCAVDGNATGSKSLSTLSTTAGKSAPHSMSEFYGYDPNVYFYFTTGGICCQSSTCSDIWWNVSMSNRVSPNVVTVCFEILTAGFSKFSDTCFMTKENTGSWVVKCQVTGINVITGFNHALIDYNDTLCARIKAYSTTIDANNTLELPSPPAVFTTGSGTACVCGTYTCTVVANAT